MLTDDTISKGANNELGLKEKTELINSKIEANIYENINSFPKAVYFIIPNELCERFCYHGISTLKFKFLMTAYGLTGETAKIVTHFFTALNLITPMIGSSISDSYLGKYHTILYFSILYLIGNMMVSVFSINGLLGEYGEYPIYSFILPALFFSLGTGGIKACVAFHGGDQFLAVQSKLREDFFSLFYATINAGALAAVFTTPYLKAYVNCFGSPCYPLAFGVPSIAFSISLVLFVIGKRYYRVVPIEENFYFGNQSKFSFWL